MAASKRVWPGPGAKGLNQTADGERKRMRREAKQTWIETGEASPIMPDDAGAEQGGQWAEGMIFSPLSMEAE